MTRRSVWKPWRICRLTTGGSTGGPTVTRMSCGRSQSRSIDTRQRGIEPLRYLAAIGDYYAHAVGADPSYSGVLAHNPAPLMRQNEFRTLWWREAPYTLDELATVIPFGWTPPKVRQTGIGRNCDLFETGMGWAGRREYQHLPVLPALLIVNQEFAPLAATVRSTRDGALDREVSRQMDSARLAQTDLDRTAAIPAAATGQVTSGEDSKAGHGHSCRPGCGHDAPGAGDKIRSVARRRPQDSCTGLVNFANTDKRGDRPAFVPPLGVGESDSQYYREIDPRPARREPGAPSPGPQNPK